MNPNQKERKTSTRSSRYVGLIMHGGYQLSLVREMSQGIKQDIAIDKANKGMDVLLRILFCIVVYFLKT